MEASKECSLCHEETVLEKHLVELTVSLNNIMTINQTEILCCDFSDHLIGLCGTERLPLVDFLKDGFGDIFKELGKLQLRILDVVDLACSFDDRLRETNLVLDNIFCSPSALLFNSVNTYILNITHNSLMGLIAANKEWDKRAIFSENKTAISPDLGPVTRYSRAVVTSYACVNYLTDFS
ncbi:hypothetical protein CHUAL_001527 [Chamberlinius hualienensis]